MSSRIDARDRLIVALDLPDASAARKMVERLEGIATFFKVGLTLQLAPGVQELIHDLIASNKKVFLDYKYYDVPETLRKAVGWAARIGVSFLTIHGARKQMEAAVAGRGSSPLKLFAVTVLTSLDLEDIRELGYPQFSVEDLVVFRAQKALEAGCDGVIASGLEAQKIKEISKDKLLVVTPAIRPRGYPGDDQKRKVTAADAIAAGADYLVIGRPITDAPDPSAAAAQFLEEMQQAFDALSNAARRVVV